MLRRLWRLIWNVDCYYCKRGDHLTCDHQWCPGCMCRIIDGHAGALR